MFHSIPVFAIVASMILIFAYTFVSGSLFMLFVIAEAASKPDEFDPDPALFSNDLEDFEYFWQVKDKVRSLIITVLLTLSTAASVLSLNILAPDSGWITFGYATLAILTVRIGGLAWLMSLEDSPIDAYLLENERQAKESPESRPFLEVVR